MPAMGPSKDYAFKVGEQVYKEFVEHLIETKKIIGLQDNPPAGFCDLETWQELKAQLKRTIQEIIWQDDAESF